MSIPFTTDVLSMFNSSLVLAAAIDASANSEFLIFITSVLSSEPSPTFIALLKSFEFSISTLSIPSPVLIVELFFSSESFIKTSSL